jgi:hypothetical protein
MSCHAISPRLIDAAQDRERCDAAPCTEAEVRLPEAFTCSILSAEGLRRRNNDRLNGMDNWLFS